MSETRENRKSDEMEQGLPENETGKTVGKTSEEVEAETTDVTRDANKAVEEGGKPASASEDMTEIERVKREAQENYDRLVRVYAEFENYKKRMEKEKVEFIKYAHEGLFKDLLGVVDNLERAVAESKKNIQSEGLARGVEMVLKQLKDTFEKYGVRPVQAEGLPFDPNLHEAMMHEPSEEHEENTVIEELQKGYVLKDRLLRPALVKVSKKIVKESDGGQAQEER